MRLLGTVEWTQLEPSSTRSTSSVHARPAVVLRYRQPRGTTRRGLADQPVRLADWKDGWFFSLGGEYDSTEQLTLRAGGAYEISPVDDADASA